MPEDDAWICPACRSPIAPRDPGWGCVGCGRFYPLVAGLPDLRIASDRYLSLENERAKAEGLASREGGVDVLGLARAYYAMTEDMDGLRRARYLAHIAHAEARGEALATILPREGRFLEVGCGTGGLLAAAARETMDIRGVDIALRWLVIARRRLRDLGLSVPLIGASADRLPWPDGTFDAVVADSLLEHLDDPLAALREFRRVLKPGGRLFAWSPNRYSLAPDPHVGLWGAGWLPHPLASRYVRWRRGCRWEVRPLSALGISRLARKAGLVPIECRPPAIPERWAGSPSGRLLLRAYGQARRLRATRASLSLFGPLWELRAGRGVAA